jgi:hypothetical protein
MEFLTSAFYGFFFGFAFGVGCALAVLYAIYSGGYRKALEDSLREPKPERYISLLVRARRKLEAGAKKEGRPTG